MAVRTVLSFDLGASSGRAILTKYDGKKLGMEEIHRFGNDPVTARGTLYWDALRLFQEIEAGIAAASKRGPFDTLGIDTWGVDFGLLGRDGALLQNPVHYRDKRTDGYQAFYRDEMPSERVYATTGIQQIWFNTLHQLYALKRTKPWLLDSAERLLFMPDLFNYLLTGEARAEYTIASTTEMLNAQTRDWDPELLRLCGARRDLLCDIVPPGTVCGGLSDEVREETGAPAGVKAICVASHDTGSAVVATPSAEERFLYLCSGTWSLLGTELKEPAISESSRAYNFTNEGGAERTIRFLKNIMGTWLNQESRRQWQKEGRAYSYDDMDRIAAEAPAFAAYLDVDDDAFIHPGDMPARVREYCARTGQPVPQTDGGVVRLICEGLCMKYRYNIEALEGTAGIATDTLHILGGASRSAYLCQMTADATGKAVFAGPVEATAIGNAAMQLIALGELGGLSDARRLVRESAQIVAYEPRAGERAQWDEHYARFKARIGAKS